MENLNTAFDVAEKHLDIPRMLDAEGTLYFERLSQKCERRGSVGNVGLKWKICSRVSELEEGNLSKKFLIVSCSVLLYS